jgi:hypothetical protein
MGYKKLDEIPVGGRRYYGHIKPPPEKEMFCAICGCRTFMKGWCHKHERKYKFHDEHVTVWRSGNCLYCGKQVPTAANTKFCIHCGKER